MSTLAEIKDAATVLGRQERKQLEDFLHTLRTHEEEAELQELYRVTGVQPVPKRGGPPVTVEMVRQICEEDGI